MVRMGVVRFVVLATFLIGAGAIVLALEERFIVTTDLRETD